MRAAKSGGRVDPGLLRAQLGGAGVPARAGGEYLDDLGVTPRNDEDREDRGDGHEDGQDRVAAQGEVRILGTAAGPTDPVGAQADPGETAHQEDSVADLRLE